LTKLRANNKKSALFGSLKLCLRDFKSPSGLLNRVATDLFESLNTPVSLSCEILLRYNEYEQLLSKSVTFTDFRDPIEARDSYQAVSFLKKVPFEVEGIDPVAAAKKKFFEAEEACLRTNRRFRKLCSGSFTPTLVTAIISMAANEVQRVLGSKVNSREWLYACRFGPGTFTHSEAKGLTSLYDKLQVRPSVSKDMVDIGALLVMSQPHWARSITDSEDSGFWPIIQEEDLDLVPGNRIAFVPKTAVTHRTIAIEPLLNIYAQLGLGAMIRRKLLINYGLDLNDQVPNQELAKLGSIDGSLATIDLSSASDTVAKELVRFFLPTEWFERMDSVRSKFGLLDDQWLSYEKFSSMGNGFTFELETLIFMSLVSAVNRHLGLEHTSARVYGDDIIVDTRAYDLLVEVLSFCGFTVNTAKSFKSGLFRESCGKDYFDGHDIRPFFQKENLHEIQHLFRLANGLRLLSHRWNNHFGCSRRLFKPWRSVLRAIPRSVALHLRVSCHAGDSDGIKSNWDESQTSAFLISNKDGWEGVSGLRFQSAPLQASPALNMLGGIASQLYRLKDGCVTGLFDEQPVPTSPRVGRGSSHKLVARAFYGPWTDFGPWRL